MAERHELRYAFWVSLLEKIKQKTTLHANISPCIYSWIGTGAGIRGLGYNYSVTYKYAQAELYIDRGKDGEAENEKIFDELFSHHDEIDKEFGEKLNWERLDNRRACRISKRFDYAGLSNKDKWADLQNDLIDAMIRLEKATKRYVKDLKI